MTTYPEHARYPWEGEIEWPVHKAMAYMKAGLTGPKNAPRYAAFSKALEAVRYLADERGVETFPGHKLKRLLIKAAAEVGWYRRNPAYKPVPAARSDDFKVCRRCKAEKPKALFLTLATPEQKRRNNWREDFQSKTLSLLCDTCRKSKNQEKARKEKRMKARQEVPDLLTAYRTSVGDALNRTKAVLRVHTVELPASDGTPVKMLQFENAYDKMYYEARLAMANLARDRLKERINDGSLSAPLPDGTSPKGLWQELLEPEERQELHALHKQGSWTQAGFRGTMPKLWDDGVRDSKRGRKTPLSERTVEPPPDVLLPVPKIPEAMPVRTLTTYDNSEWDIDLTKPE